MIIKKNMLKKKDWPFTVSEITVMTIEIETKLAFLIIHNFKAFALSGLLESHGFKPLVKSNIWDDHKNIKGIKKSLTPFFIFLNNITKK